MIPKVIHYCWFGENPKDKKTKKCIRSWRKYCPGYEIKEWSEQNFDINMNQYVKEAYSAKQWAFVSDYVRLYALYHEGGIYMDTDVELLKKLDNYLIHSAFSGFQSEKEIQTAIMGSEKKGEWVKYLLDDYKERHFIMENEHLDTTTNVTAITRLTKEKYNIELNNVYNEIDESLVLYPTEYFCPKSFITGEINCTNNTVCIHHFNASWLTEEDKTRIENYKKSIRKNSIYDKIDSLIHIPNKIALFILGEESYNNIKKCLRRKR